MGKKIIVVDPDVGFRKLISNSLEGRGHNVMQLNNTLECERDFLKNSNIKTDLLVIGMPLPGGPGEIYSWIESIRHSGNAVPIIYVAQNKEELADAKEKLNQLEISMFSAKPVIPFIFGAQIECQFSEEGNGAGGQDARKQKLKDFETMFLALVSKYARVLPEKLEDIKKVLERSKSNLAENSHLDEIRGQSHKIKGTGGSLGFSKVAEHMAFIELRSQEITLLELNDRSDALKEIEERLELALAEGKTETEEVLAALHSLNQDMGLDVKPQSMARIMIIDEDKDFLKAVENLGQESLVEVICASNQKEALDRASVYALDAALISLSSNMAESGFEIAKQLRALPEYDNLPLAFVSDEGLIKDRVEAAHAGASLYLDKPFESDSLEKAVQHLVAIRQGGRARVLITDDDEFFANTIGVVLRNEGIIVKTLNDPGQILEAMQEFPPDLLLLDVMMPGVTGFEVCRMLRQIPRWSDLPIIFLTGQTGVEARLEAFRSGGDDYLPKPVVNEELLTRVKVRLDRARMLKERSDKDTITGLLLRRAFSEQLNAILAESERIKANFSLCILDVDHFKKVNDTYGHLAGDKVLAGFGQLLSRRFRVDDLRGRWGGEEFVLAFRRERKEVIHKAIERVLEEFREIAFTGDEGQTFHCSFSGGLVTFPEDGGSIFELLQKADQRLYIAKKNGRNQIVFQSPDLEEEVEKLSTH